MSTGDFQITGVSTSAAYTTFSEGTATITDGEGITSEDEGTNQVLIESSLAEANDLAVGDTFSITDAEDNEVEVTVKGIYETSEVGNSMSQMFNLAEVLTSKLYEATPSKSAIAWASVIATGVD